MKLVIAMHYAEASCVDYEDIDRIECLANAFVLEFSSLYGVRHVVQVVHSVSHVASTVADFGPLSSFTTFNFENELGKLNKGCMRERNRYFLCFPGLMTRTCKSTRRHALEIMNNLTILREAHHHLLDPEIDSTLIDLIFTWISRPNKYNGDQSIYKLMHRSKQSDRIVCLVFNTSSIVFYSAIFIERVRFTTWTYARGKATDDSCILFTSAQTKPFGRISGIFTLNDDHEPMFRVQVLSNRKSLEYYFDDDTMDEFTDMQTGQLKDDNYLIVRATDILEKCVSFHHVPAKTFTLMRFPNLTESS